MRFACLAVAAVLLAAGAASAEAGGAYEAGVLRADGSLVVDASLWRVAAPATAPADLHHLMVTGATLTVRTLTTYWYDLPGGELRDTTRGGWSPPVQLRDGSLTLKEAGDDFGVNVDAETVLFEGTLGPLGLSAMVDPVMTGAGIEGRVGQGDVNMVAGMESRWRDGRFVYGLAKGSPADLHLAGDFHLQLYGVSLVTDGPKAQEFTSGRYADPAFPAPSASPVQSYEVRVLHVAVEDGFLEAYATDAWTEWVSRVTRLATEDTVQLYEVSAPVRVPHVELHGPVQVEATVGTTGVKVDVLPMPGSGAQVQRAPGISNPVFTSVGGFAALGSVAAILIVRRRPEPSMKQVEAELSTGRHARAARLAKRILRRHPGQDDAMLARSIALSKAGHPRRVVVELTRHLQHKPAADGTLPYVLGLAYMDLGRTDDARAAFEHAVHLTPALRTEVAPRLDLTPGGPLASPSSATGYA